MTINIKMKNKEIVSCINYAKLEIIEWQNALKFLEQKLQEHETKSAKKAENNAKNKKK